MCVSPTVIHVDGSLRYYPCNKCIECRRSYRQSWQIRIYNEFVRAGAPYFITLTYRDDSVPLYLDCGTGAVWSSLSYKPFSIVMKRFRAACAYKGIDLSNFSFCFCTEYGGKTHRAHLHGLFFGLTRSQLELFRRYWHKYYGFTSVKRAGCTMDDRLKVSNYVSKYVLKLTGDVAYNKWFDDFYSRNPKAQKPRMRSSLGFGQVYDTEVLFNYNFKEVRLKSVKHFVKFVPAWLKTSRLPSKVIDGFEYLKFPMGGFDFNFPRVLRWTFYEKNYYAIFQKFHEACDLSLSRNGFQNFLAMLSFSSVVHNLLRIRESGMYVKDMQGYQEALSILNSETKKDVATLCKKELRRASYF